jgi:Tol biopolymer transport system component
MLPAPGADQKGAPVPESQVRRQLARILASETLSRSERLSRLLAFVVAETLAGRAATLKEQVLACELYGRGAEFTAATDPVVRVDARRLRDKLREYYSEFPEDEVLITLPRGGYVPSFQWSPQARVSKTAAAGTAEPEQASISSPSWQTLLWLAIGGVSVVAGVGIAIWWGAPTSPDAPQKLVPLTSSPGNEWWPSLSPDGNFVAFLCPGADQDNSTDICVKAVAAETIQRVVATSAVEGSPAWSPDGKEIAFTRNARTKEQGIFIVSRIGGAERRVSESGTAVAWAPDGKSVLVRDRLHEEPAPSGIFQVDLGSLQRRRLTNPRVGGGDWYFDVSPNGKTVAFIRYQRPGVSDLYVAPMSGGEPRRLTEWNTILFGPAWTPDGKEIIYAVNDRLWRISAAASKPGTGVQIPGIPEPARQLSISRPRVGQAARLAFYTPREQISLRKVDLKTATADGILGGIVPVAASSRRDIPGPFSPDGARVAFTSTRASTDYELWVAASDGSHPRQLTSIGPNTLMMAHAWSPDGRKILFEAAVDGNSDLYIISAEGGDPVRLTSSPAIEGLADWSRDGRWIYYTKVSAGMHGEIWRIPAEGGTGEQIMKTGGSAPQASPDGRHIYCLDRPPHGGVSGRLMRIQAGTEAPAVIDDQIYPFYWSVADVGIYFVREEGGQHSIHLYRFADEKSERVGTLPFRLAYFPRGPGRLTVSRDGRWALVNVADRREGDLMLLDNFR